MIPGQSQHGPRYLQVIRNYATKGDSSQSDWLVSLGDLLTLLLVFFLSIMARSPMNPANHGEETVKGRDRSADAAAGTALALSKNTNGKVTQPERREASNHATLSLVDFEADSSVMKESGINTLKTIVDSALYDGRSILIETCSPDHNAVAAAAWHDSMGKAFTIRSQLIDGGFSASLIKIRAGGPHCEMFGTPAGEQQVVAKVTWVLAAANG